VLLKLQNARCNDKENRILLVMWVFSKGGCSTYKIRTGQLHIIIWKFYCRTSLVSTMQCKNCLKHRPTSYLYYFVNTIQSSGFTEAD